MLAVVFANISLWKPSSVVPHGLVVRIRRSHRRGPGSIPGVGNTLVFSHNLVGILCLFCIAFCLQGYFVEWMVSRSFFILPGHIAVMFLFCALYKLRRYLKTRSKRKLLYQPVWLASHFFLIAHRGGSTLYGSNRYSVKLPSCCFCALKR